MRKVRNRDVGARNRARRLRKTMSVSERLMWRWLRHEKIGFKFRRQYPVGSYALDFYCVEARLCVEVDGEQHARTVDRDKARDEFLLKKGILTYRFPSLELFDPKDTNILAILEELQNLCVLRSDRTPFPEE